MDTDGEGASAWDSDLCESDDDDGFVYNEFDDDEDETFVLQMVLDGAELQQPQNNNGAITSIARKTRVPDPILWTDDDGTERHFRPQHTFWLVQCLRPSSSSA